MSKKTYRVQHAGQEFTRATARTYSHIVLAKPCRESDLRNMLNNAGWSVNADWEYYEREGGDNPRFSHSEQRMAEIKRIAALGKDGWLKEKTDWAHSVVAKRTAEGQYDRFFDYGWCGRADLAAKQGQKAMNSGCYAEVLIVEVPQN